MHWQFRGEPCSSWHVTLISHIHYAYHTDLAARTDATHVNHITVIIMSSRSLRYHHPALTYPRLKSSNHLTLKLTPPPSLSPCLRVHRRNGPQPCLSGPRLLTASGYRWITITRRINKRGRRGVRSARPSVHRPPFHPRRTASFSFCGTCFLRKDARRCFG